MSDDDLGARAYKVHKKLLEMYGRNHRKSGYDPVEQLVSTILSQNTNDNLRDQAYESLRQRFDTWEAVRDAPQDEVTAAIQIAGLAQQKAPAIQRALRRIWEERGEINLDFLVHMELEEAREWLTALKGVGPKTAAIVLLFSLGKPAFPVDTHVHRVTKRLGLIPSNASREKAHKILEAMMPPETYYDLHLNLIRHGRRVCGARRPDCEDCGLGVLCDYYESTRIGGVGPEDGDWLGGNR